MSNNKVFQDPLLEWNRLNKLNAEQQMVSVMFSSMISTSPIIDRFSTWLLAGTGATAALFVTNINKILPFLTVKGFKTCGAILAVSAILGFCAKYKAIRCQIAFEVDCRIRTLSPSIFEEYFKQKDQIEKNAEDRGLELETEINQANIINEFSKPFPFWVKWLMVLILKKNDGNIQIGYISPVKLYCSQSSMALFQGLCFLAFLVVAIYFAKPI